MPTTIEAFVAQLNHNGKDLKVQFQNNVLAITGIESGMAFGFIGTLFGALGQLGAIINVPPMPLSAIDASAQKIADRAPAPRKCREKPAVTQEVVAPSEVSETSRISCEKQERVLVTAATAPNANVVATAEPAEAAGKIELFASSSAAIARAEDVSSDADEDAPIPDDSIPGVVIDGGVPEEQQVMQSTSLHIVPGPASVAVVPFSVEQAAKDLDGVNYMGKIVNYFIDHGVRSRAAMLECAKQLRSHHRAIGKVIDDALLKDRIDRACVGVLGVTE